jgi:hypothetical protein
MVKVKNAVAAPAIYLLSKDEANAFEQAAALQREEVRSLWDRQPRARIVWLLIYLLVCFCSVLGTLFFLGPPPEEVTRLDICLATFCLVVFVVTVCKFFLTLSDIE